MHIYKRSESRLWTVGYFDPQNNSRWVPLVDCYSETAAQCWTSYLNGGKRPDESHR